MLLTWPPFCEVCMNYEVAMLQPRKGKYPDLGSIAIITLLTILPTPSVTTMFWIFIYPPVPTSYHPPPICTYLCCTLFYLPNYPGSGASVHLDDTPTLRPPTLIPLIPSLVILNLLPRFLLPPGVLRRMPVTSVSLVHSPPILCPIPATRSLSSPRGSPFQGPLPPVVLYF